MTSTDHQVFISHATPDLELALRICDALEERGFDCWIAARDLETSSGFGPEIIRQIRQAGAVVFILSEAANEAAWVPREIERALHYGVPVFPVRTENVLPATSLELFVSTSQWIDLWSGDFDERMDRLALDLRKRSRTAGDHDPSEQAPGTDTGADETVTPFPRPPPESGAKRAWIRKYGAFVAAALALAVFGVLNLTQGLMGGGDDRPVVHADSAAPDSLPAPDSTIQPTPRPDQPQGGAEQAEADGTSEPRESEPAASASGPPVPADRVLVTVYGPEGSGASTVEGLLLAELAERGVPSMDRVQLDPALATSPLPLHAEHLDDLRRRAGVATVVVGDLRVEAAPSVGTMYTGRATLSVRLYDTATGRLVGTHTFQIGADGRPGEIGASAMAASQGAATRVAHKAAGPLARELQSP